MALFPIYGPCNIARRRARTGRRSQLIKRQVVVWKVLFWRCPLQPANQLFAQRLSRDRASRDFPQGDEVAGFARRPNARRSPAPELPRPFSSQQHQFEVIGNLLQAVLNRDARHRTLSVTKQVATSLGRLDGRPSLSRPLRAVRDSASSTQGLCPAYKEKICDRADALNPVEALCRVRDRRPAREIWCGPQLVQDAGDGRISAVRGCLRGR